MKWVNHIINILIFVKNESKRKYTNYLQLSKLGIYYVGKVEKEHIGKPPRLMSQDILTERVRHGLEGSESPTELRHRLYISFFTLSNEYFPKALKTIDTQTLLYAIDYSTF